VTLLAEQVYTAADLWSLSHSPEYDNRVLELSAGSLIVMSLVGWKHGVLASSLTRLISAYVKHHQLGQTTAAGTGFILHQSPDGDTVRAPDVGFIAQARFDTLQSETGFVPFAPDLAVEVISPSENSASVHQKVTEYLKYGTHMVWLVYPDPHIIAVYTPGTFHSLTVDDQLTGGEVLPGFSVLIREIFTL
jgi:Uma2 family endonuclease